MFDVWFSRPFYSHRNGYKLCVGVSPQGTRTFFGKSSYLAICIYLMKGPYDDSLNWPFKGKITIQLLNQQKNESHCEDTIVFDDSTSAMCCERYKVNTDCFLSTCQILTNLRWLLNTWYTYVSLPIFMVSESMQSLG